MLVVGKGGPVGGVFMVPPRKRLRSSQEGNIGSQAAHSDVLDICSDLAYQNPPSHPDN